MPETLLYVVRHGETDYNRRRIMQGRRVNASLNETGRAQARALARRFAAEPLDAVYSSTLRRAEETANAIAAAHPDVPRFRLADLDEMSWGVLEGQGHSPSLDRALDEMYARWAEGDYDYRVEGGESIREVQARALRAVDRILQRHAGDRVLVVAHGRLIRVLLASVLDAYGLDRMHEIEHANTSVNRLVHTGGRFEAALLNCTVHLDDRPELCPVPDGVASA